MFRPFIRISFLAALLFTGACTQEVAQIDLKGQTTYGRNGSAGYASVHNAPLRPLRATAPGVAHATQSAQVQAIAVRDLAPAAGGNKPQPQPTLNPWTNSPHFESGDEAFNIRPHSPAPAKPQMVSDIGAPTPAAPALAHVISSDNAPSKAAVKTASRSAGFIWPVASKKIVSSFGPKGGGKVNDGINIASGEGEPVWAAADGEVIYAGNELAGYGNMIILRHAGGKTSTYAHLNRAVSDKTDRVKQGDIIGYVGATGNVTSPQLHFAIRDGREPVDPQKYLGRKLAAAE